MPRVLGLGLIYFLIATFSVPAAAQVYEAWVARYNGLGNGSDYANNALAVDGSGNVYVTGYSTGSGTFGDYATIKYDSNGDTLWVRRDNGPGNGSDAGYALAVDDSGNVYVTGQSYGSGTFEDYATLKYDSNGDTLWVRRYNGPGNDYDWANALAVDDSGNVIVTGWSVGSGTSYDHATLKYDSDGDTLWVRRYNGPGNDNDFARSLAIDDSGNVFVTGSSIGSGTSEDYATIKYSPCAALSGDANASGTLTLGDVLSAVNYVFNKPGWSACGSNSTLCWLSDLLCRGDWNGNGTCSVGDVIHGVNFYFNKPGDWTPVATGACCLTAP